MESGATLQARARTTTMNNWTLHLKTLKSSKHTFYVEEEEIENLDDKEVDQ